MSDEIKRVDTALQALISKAKTLMMSIPSETESLSEIGVSPFIQHEGHLYIYASHLSAHIRQLQGSTKAVFMIIADESKSQNIWARHRLKFQANVIEIMRDDPRFDVACDRIKDAHGPVMDLIRNFADFHLFEITPETGVFVSGFGAAFSVSGADFAVGAKLRSS